MNKYIGRVKEYFSIMNRIYHHHHHRRRLSRHNMNQHIDSILYRKIKQINNTIYIYFFSYAIIFNIYIYGYIKLK